MTVATVGLWHLGTVTSACLASAGYRVVGFDSDADLIAGLCKGHLPVFEPGLEDLVHQGMAAGRLTFSSDPQAVAEAEIVWIAYDTPVDENDQADVAYVVDRCAALFPYLSQGALVLISSQLPVGTTRRLEELYRLARPEGLATFAYSPENLRLGKAIEAFSRPERIVAGIRTEKDRGRIEQLVKPFSETVEWMSVESAEMTKHALNAFLATSVAFINELSGLCERVGADAREVERGLKSDVRIGPRAYLRPGSAFAGGTLARDVSFLIDIGKDQGLPTHLVSAVARSNEAHRGWQRRRLIEILGDLRGRSIAMLGLTYKPRTDTLRRSAAIETCRWLGEQAARVAAYDPAVKTLPPALTPFTTLCPSMEAALAGAEAVLICTEWEEFESLRADDLAKWMVRPVVLDSGRFLEANLAGDERIRYIAVGKAA